MITPEVREQFRTEQAKQVKTWIEQRVWDLCDDISKGYNSLKDYSDAEVCAYARGVLHSLEWMGERFECDAVAMRTLVDGALGERYHRTNSPAGKLHRRLFAKLITQIRAKRVAMVDNYESLDYRGEYEVWRKRVWAIERVGVPQEEYAEFNQLRHELNAIWALSSWLLNSGHWRNENWQRRKEVKVAA